jgi:ABC-type spermidine/putrescine transport system permease subunit II
MLRITLPLVVPGVLGAAIFVFAEMLGSFAAAFVLGIPGRFYVVTTVIWQATLSFPPDYGRAAAMGLSLFGVMLITLTLARLVLRHGTYTTITGKAFRPREMDVGRMRWPLLGIAWGYIIVAVVLPLAALLLTSFERFATVILPQMQFTTANYTTALQMGSVGPAFINSLILGLSVATIGVVVIGVLAWIIYRSRMPGSAPSSDRARSMIRASRLVRTASVAVVPTVLIYPAGETGQQVEEQNTAEMLQSQDSAAIAALRHLGDVTEHVVHRTAVLRQRGVRGDVRTRCNLALDPVGERTFGGDLARDLQPVHDRLLVVAVLVGEVPEVAGRLDVGVFREQVQAAGRV